MHRLIQKKDRVGRLLNKFDELLKNFAPYEFAALTAAVIANTAALLLNNKALGAGFSGLGGKGKKGPKGRGRLGRAASAVKNVLTKGGAVAATTAAATTVAKKVKPTPVRGPSAVSSKPTPVKGVSTSNAVKAVAGTSTRLASKTIPIFGGLAAFGYAAKLLHDGDYEGAMVQMLAGGANFVPFAGPFMAAGIEGLYVANKMGAFDANQTAAPKTHPLAGRSRNRKPTSAPTTLRMTNHAFAGRSKTRSRASLINPTTQMDESLISTPESSIVEEKKRDMAVAEANQRQTTTGVFQKISDDIIESNNKLHEIIELNRASNEINSGVLKGVDTIGEVNAYVKQPEKIGRPRGYGEMYSGMSDSF